MRVFIMSKNESCREPIPLHFRNSFHICDPRMGLKCMVGGAGLGIMSSLYYNVNIGDICFSLFFRIFVLFKTS